MEPEASNINTIRLASAAETSFSPVNRTKIALKITAQFKFKMCFFILASWYVSGGNGDAEIRIEIQSSLARTFSVVQSGPVRSGNIPRL